MSIASLKKFNVFIEYIKPTYDKTVWGTVSYANGWRHARLVVTKNPVPFITQDITGRIYDAGSDKPDKELEKLSVEDFRPTSFHRYLPIGNTKLAESAIITKRDEAVKIAAKYNLFSNNCEDFARTIGRSIIEETFPELRKKLVTTHSESIIYIDVSEPPSFDEAMLFDPLRLLSSLPSGTSLATVSTESTTTTTGTTTTTATTTTPGTTTTEPSSTTTK